MVMDCLFFWYFSTYSKLPKGGGEHPPAGKTGVVCCFCCCNSVAVAIPRPTGAGCVASAPSGVVWPGFLAGCCRACSSAAPLPPLPYPDAISWEPDTCFQPSLLILLSSSPAFTAGFTLQQLQQKTTVEHTKIYQEGHFHSKHGHLRWLTGSQVLQCTVMSAPCCRLSTTPCLPPKK